MEKDREYSSTKLERLTGKWAVKVANAEKETGRLTEEIAKVSLQVKSLAESHTKEVEVLNGKIKKLEDDLLTVKTRNAELLKGQSKDLTLKELLKLIFYKIGRR